MAHHAPDITLTLPMYHHSRDNRILSLDVHSKTLAYAVFEDATQLLDFSVSRSAHSGFQVTRVEKLVRKFQPEVIVLRRIPAGSSRDTPAARAAVRSIRSKARSLSVRVVFIDKRNIDATFRDHCKPTKHRIAVLLAACFQVLAWYVPRERKPWTPEDRRMQYFDAAAAGLAYFASEGNAETVRELLSEAEARSQSLNRDT
jgi:hypothetical protein